MESNIKNSAEINISKYEQTAYIIGAAQHFGLNYDQANAFFRWLPNQIPADYDMVSYLQKYKNDEAVIREKHLQEA
ncbi:MAG TPA: hypothetical protein VMR49_01795 [Candidatus Paceibacterota bacterium]|nr:hypothetical protein [Candidatus Paceibacterota bacterium]